MLEFQEIQEMQEVPEVQVVAMDIDLSNDSNLGEEHEVFLSFCGEDTRKRFTDVLYTFLVQARVRTFRDSENLHVGETIGPQLIKCIRQSKISIPVFSKNYAESKWCLMELFEMIQMLRCDKCRNGNHEIRLSKCLNCVAKKCQHKIIPIFYDVSPDDVKLKTEVYDQFFPKHILDYKKDTVQSWKNALKDVGQLKGLELAKETNGFEGELAKKVIDLVLQTLKKSEVELPEILVGMKHHKEQLKVFLEPDFSCTRILGIHGMGGIGKSTIAKVIFNELCKSYEFCCFLENFEENSKGSNHLIELQSQVVSDLSRVRFPKILNMEKGRDAIKDVIKDKKYLLVLDDMDKESHFVDFFGNCSLVDPGSKRVIIVTTRNMAVLNYLKGKYEKDSFFKIYEPQLMDTDQSCRLFCNIAFNEDSPPENSAIKETEFTAFGLPLALKHAAQEHKAKLLQDCQEYGTANRGIGNISHEVIFEKFKRCFRTLNDGQQHVFLDTACLFVGEDEIEEDHNVSSEEDNVDSSYMSEDCGVYPINNVHANVMKDCRVPYYMWDDCGLDSESYISANVMRSLIKIKGDNSLWMHPQIRDFGRDINRKESIDRPGKRKRLWLREEALEIFERRKGTDAVLAICLNFIKDDLESRNSLKREDFGELRNLRFLKAGSIDLEGNFDYIFSDLRWLQWKPSGNIVPSKCMLTNLVVLDLSESEIMDDWEGWNEIRRSKKLKVLNLSKCNNLSMAPNLSMFKLLERLILASCHYLDDISTVNLKTLRLLNISHCTILRGAQDFSRIPNLEHLDVNCCTQLTSLTSIESLSKLKYLDTSGCDNLETLPNLSHLQELKTLRCTDCKKLTEILGLHMLVCLKHLDISGCVNIVQNIPNIPKIPCFPNISNISKLEIKEVSISRCNITVAEALGIWNLKSVETLDASWCTSEEHIEEKILDLSKLSKLKILNLAGFGNFSKIQGLEVLESLEELNINNWKTIQNLGDLSNLKKLKVIYAQHCKNLSEITGLEILESFQQLYIFGCESLEPLPNLPTRKIVLEMH